MLTPTRVDVGSQVMAIAAGDRHTCVVAKPNAVFCWGDNSDGQVAPTMSAGMFADPVRVLTEEDFNANGATSSFIAAGVSHSCARTLGGHAICWGKSDDDFFRLGTTDDAIPTVSYPNKSPASVHRLSAGDTLSCAIDPSDGNLICWGKFYGDMLPGARPTVGTFSAVSVGFDHFCAILPNNRLQCGGSNQIINGDGPSYKAGGTGMDSEMLEDVASVNFQVTEVSAGTDHTCVLSGTGVRCWGYGPHGEAGDGNSGPATPNLIPGTEEMVSISAGNRVTCGIIDGRIHCWGANDRGQLGLGVRDDGVHDTPAPILLNPTTD